MDFTNVYHKFLRLAKLVVGSVVSFCFIHQKMDINELVINVCSISACLRAY